MIAENALMRSEWIDQNQIGPIIRQLMYVYCDESYVNKNHSIGYTWYHTEDECGSAAYIPSGKGERIVMLTAITIELEMLSLGDEDCYTLLLFQARKKTGDYLLNMDNHEFCRWLDTLLHVLDKKAIQMILVMDNASYHLNPAMGSVNVAPWTTKENATTFLDHWEIPYGAGRAPCGDSLHQLKLIASDWPETNKALNNIIVDLTRVQQILKERGHFSPMLTPPYHPELQPIEDLWRDVKQYVARHFLRQRSFAEMRQDIVEAFHLYGTVESCVGYLKATNEREKKYINVGVYAAPVDLTAPEYQDETDDECSYARDEDFYGSDTDDDEE